jgi:hypothetical protein
MSGSREHELYKRRFSRNVGVGVVLGVFIILVFGLTIAKVSRGDPMEGFDHSVRSSVLPAETQGGY